MPDKIGNLPTPSPSSQPPSHGKAEKTKSFKEVHGESTGAGGTFLGMHVTEKQKKQIYANLSKQVIASIKHDQQRQEKALRNLRNVTEGKEMEP